eukprot:TRINITY_DN8485_c0_g1_i2.p1 TRINITY_DN8485_c0_g1~~TRINITY_DN8485_c0_g1_i2.p1  ORF type:complete len:135 (-),score=43.44 TRINITY_DN8485_c0_g1_i2:43-447(-)
MCIRDRSDLCDVYLRPLDKKSERSVVHAEMKELEANFGHESNCSSALVLCTQLLHTKATKTLLYVNSRCVQEAVAYLCANEDVSEEIRAALTALSECIHVHRSLEEQEKQEAATEMEAQLVTLKELVLTKPTKP